MSKRRKKASSGPNDGYLISFGDTMTALLAFFIVLNSLASEQTGANLYSGTGSFIQATDALGVPGMFRSKMSRNSLQLGESAPLYVVGESESDEPGHGPDDEEDTIFIRDQELQNFERLLNELERIHERATVRETRGEVAFDRLEPLPSTGSPVDDEMRELFKQLAPFLRRRDSEAEIIVWTPTPAVTAWQRTAIIAEELNKGAASYLKLNRDQQQRLTSSSRQWSYPDIQRPAVSILVRVESAEK